MLLPIKLCLAISTVNCVSAGLRANNPTLHKNEKTREVRSPNNCGDCDLNIHDTYHQNFNAPVEFNQFIISDCCNGAGCTCTAEPGLRPPRIPTTRPPPPPSTTRAPPPPPTTTRAPPPPTTTRAPPPPTTTRAPPPPTTTTRAPPLPPTAPTPPTTAPPPTTALPPTNKTKIFKKKFETEKIGLDLYYIMDGTQSFEPSRKQLADKATQFTESFKKLSRDYQLGLGIFVDKNGQPARDDQLERVATVSVGLWNIMPLTNDLQNFSSKVAKYQTQQSGRNEDIFTALHQGAVCTSKVGWRNTTKKFILLTTDQRYYQAGDKPIAEDGTPTSAYDAKCHLNGQNIYRGSEYDKVDYPSVDQIKTVIQDNGITVIFGIGQAPLSDNPGPIPIINTYLDLSPQIIPSPIVTPLDTNSSTIVDDLIKLIRDAYEESSKSLNIETTITGPKEITQKVIFVTKCKSSTINTTDINNGKIIDTCGVPSDGTVNYEIEVTLPCPWTYGDVKLTSNVLGQSDDEDLELASVCN